MILESVCNRKRYYKKSHLIHRLAICSGWTPGAGSPLYPWCSASTPPLCVYILVAPPIHHSAALSDPNPFVWTLVSRQIPPLPRASPTYDCKYTDRGMCKYCIHPTPHIEPSCVNIVEQDLYCGVCVNIGNVSKSAAISDALGGPNSQLPKWRTAQIQVHVGISQKYISCTLISVLSNCHSWR